mmetsp:Transcript_47125/g.111074  ORF Transcript_47125/g.111074 Transcript_47125/m.111074 type:complete len:210 (-) Transcript_47125:1597-2226(-)
MSPSKYRKQPWVTAVSCMEAPEVASLQPLEASRALPISCPCIDMCIASSTCLPPKSSFAMRTCSTRRSVSASASETATQYRPLDSGRSQPEVSNRRIPLAVTPLSSPSPSPNSASSWSSSCSLALRSVAASTTSPSPSFDRPSFPEPLWKESSVCTFFSAASCWASSWQASWCSSGVTSRSRSELQSGAHSTMTTTFLIRLRPLHAGLK